MEVAQMPGRGSKKRPIGFLLGLVVAGGVAAATVLSAGDIKRYLRIRSM